jgi:peptidoglycan/xylan/chitin deacetylase (PgdA/CDA1 family)
MERDARRRTDLTLSPERERFEIRESREYLRELTGGALGSFSYPHGGHDADTVAAVRDAGFERACCSRRRVVRSRTDAFALPRVTVPDCDGDAFAALLWSYMGH